MPYKVTKIFRANRMRGYFPGEIISDVEYAIIPKHKQVNCIKVEQYQKWYDSHPKRQDNPNRYYKTTPTDQHNITLVGSVYKEF